MKNAIVYSLHSNSPKLDSLLQWRQTRYSLDTLRSLNPDIPVKVYLSPPGILDTAIMPYRKDNVEYIEFDADADIRMDDINKARLTNHKWISTFDALSRFNFDNVLYVDGDTIWYKDPEILFSKYGGNESIYSKIEHMDDLKKTLGIKNDIMNDGINMVSKYILKYKDYILKERYDRTYAWQEQFRNCHDEDLRYGIQWAACQYAISEAMSDIGNEVKYFDISDVLLASDEMGCHEPHNSGAIVFHYLNCNSSKFLPAKYMLSVGSKTEHGKILKIYRDGEDTIIKTDVQELNALAFF